MLAITDEIFQILTPDSEIVGEMPDLSADQMVEMYRWMVFGRTFSDRMVALQRQGRMGTFAPVNGQEATCIGIAAPMQPEDWLVGSYRENLTYMFRGVPALAIMQQWGGDIPDSYSVETHCLPFQVVLGNQMLHATGVAQAIKYDKKPHVVVAVCGDGATSEGDFHEALNLAGVFQAPVVFVVQNNGWAISVPRARQTAAKYIAHRGPGYGIPGYIVDGNDLLAVYKIMADSVARARAGDGPTLIEAITYRLGAHTTSDDPKKYRPESELQEWLKRDPIPRFRKFLLANDLLTEAEDQRLHQEVDAELQAVIEAYEALPPQSLDQLFNLVYAEMPPQLRRQYAELMPKSERVEPLQPAPRQQREFVRELELA